MKYRMNRIDEIIEALQEQRLCQLRRTNSDFDESIRSLKTNASEINIPYLNTIPIENTSTPPVSYSSYFPANNTEVNKPSKQRLQVIEDIFNPASQSDFDDFMNKITTNRIKNNTLDQLDMSSNDLEWSKLRRQKGGRLSYIKNRRQRLKSKYRLINMKK